MLPSMPLLMAPMKELGDDSSTSSDDSPNRQDSKTHNGSPTCTPIENGVSEIENGVSEHQIDSSVPSLTTGNSTENCGNGPTVTHEGDQVKEKCPSPEKRPSSEPTSAQKKKKKNQHKKILASLTLEGSESFEAAAQNFAEAYFEKVRNCLDDKKWLEFVQELVSFEEQPVAERRPVELYRKMERLLSPHTDLVDEFLKFLLPHQALEVDRVMDYLSLDKMSDFFRKLNIILMKRQVRLVYAALETLSVKPNVTLSEVKDSILPLIKSSSLLTSLFLALLPGERPPDSLMTDFEQVDWKDDSEFETIVVPDCPDPYGNESCVCHCHKAQTRHCFACGIKYLNGRVYIQCGKSLRPAKVVFKDEKHSDILKWEGEKSRNRRRLLPKTMLSPGVLDHRLNADSEEDCGAKKSPRTPRTRVNRRKVCKKETSENKEEVLAGILPLAESKVGDNNTEELVDSEMKHDGIDEHDFDEIVLENECNTEEEEEYLNKGLNSENESSIEAEDIAKELECSYDDEEVDDFEHSEIDIGESIANQKDNEKEKATNEESNNSHCKSFSKTVEMEAEPTTKENLQVTDTGLETTSIKDKFDYIDNIKNEPMSVSSAREVEEPVKEEIADQPNYEADSNYVIKMEEEEIIDVCSGQCVDNDSSVGTPSGGGNNQVDSSFKEWTKEEDKTILLTFQHESGLEQTFKTASLQLPNRTQEEIQQRFEVLLKLLKEMYPNHETLTHNK